MEPVEEKAEDDFISQLSDIVDEMPVQEDEEGDIESEVVDMGRALAAKNGTMTKKQQQQAKLFWKQFKDKFDAKKIQSKLKKFFNGLKKNITKSSTYKIKRPNGTKSKNSTKAKSAYRKRARKY